MPKFKVAIDEHRTGYIDNELYKEIYPKLGWQDNEVNYTAMLMEEKETNEDDKPKDITGLYLEEVRTIYLVVEADSFNEAEKKAEEIYQEQYETLKWEYKSLLDVDVVDFNVRQEKKYGT